MKRLFAKVSKLSSYGQYYVLSMLLLISSFIGIMSNSTTVNAAVGSVTQYNTPNSASITKIGAGPDGNIWYTGANRIGKVTSSGTFTQYLSPLNDGRYPNDITTGPDGNIWYSENPANSTSRIVKMSTSGAVLGQYQTSYTTSSPVADSLITGSNGDLWFAYDGKIGNVSSSNAVTFKAPPTGVGAVRSITLGSDGNIWYTAASKGSSTQNSVGKMTPSGVYTNYNFPSTYTNSSENIITGPDGNVWFTMNGKQFVVKVTSTGVMTEYNPGTGSLPVAITTGTDGNLWYVANSTGKVGRLTTSGVFTEYSVAGLGVYSYKDIVAGSGGSVWIQDGYAGKLIRVATELNAQTIAFTSNAPTTATVDGTTYTPSASATSGLPVTYTIDSSSSNTCSISVNNVVSFQGAGTCIINADQVGDGDYKPAPQVQQSFTVSPVDADSSVAVNCPSGANVGDTVTCSITVANNGPAASENASLAAIFPASFSNVSLSSAGTLSGQHITWTVPSLNSGDTVTLSLTATLSASGKQRLNAALLQTSPDPNTSNNITVSTITVN